MLDMCHAVHGITATGINSHLRLDPVTKKKCCPMAHKSDAHRITITTEDEAYTQGPRTG
jgi:hypothetical protein